MTLRIRGKSLALRRGGAFTFSLCIHGAALAWVIANASLGFGEKPKALYEQEIRPFEGKIIWYHLQTRVPDVRPAEAAPARKPPRAVRKLDQNLIAGKKELSAPPLKVWVPDPPQAEPPKPLLDPLPNLLAFAPALKTPLRTFQPPPAPPVKANPAVELPDAPEAMPRQAAASRQDLPLAMNLPRAVRAFTPPPQMQRKQAAPQADVAAPDVTPLDAPAPTIAIVGLDPAKTMEIPKPPPPREAGFSAGPKPAPDGDSAPASTATLSVPSIYASGGPKDMPQPTASDLPPASRKSLIAAMIGGVPPPRVPAPSGPRAPHVSSSPDPRMNGRMIYMMAIQMPTITSFSGSWMVWFAEHRPLPGAPPLEMRAPEPMRKVDPRYVASAANERVEGIVRLAAVIRKDGSIDEVELLKHLDDRLDQSAQQALAKWRFEPASRDGTPVDVDAVFEIPFRLAPRAAR